MNRLLNRILDTSIILSVILNPFREAGARPGLDPQITRGGKALFTQQAMALDAVAHTKPAAGKGAMYLDEAAATLIRKPGGGPRTVRKSKMWQTQGKVLIPDAELPPDALSAIQQMRSYVDPHGQRSAAEMIDASGRRPGSTTTGILIIRSEDGPMKRFIIPSGIRDLVKRANFHSVRGTSAVGLLGWHIGEEGQAQWNAKPVIGLVIFRWGDDYKIRLVDRTGAEFEEDLSSKRARNPLVEVPIFGRFVDALLYPRSAAERRGLALRLFTKEKLERRATKKMEDHVHLRGRQFAMARFESWIPVEHSLADHGTMIRAMHDLSQNSIWALLIEETAPPDLLRHGPWLLIHDDPWAPAPVLEMAGPAGEIQPVPMLRDSRFVSLYGCPLFRDYIDQLEKAWKASTHRKGPISVGDRINMVTNLTRQAVVMRPAMIAGIEAGTRSNQVLLLPFVDRALLKESDIAPIAMQPLRALFDESELTERGLPGEQSLLTALEGGILLPPRLLNSLQEHSIAGWRIPANIPGEIQVVFRKSQKPAFILKTFRTGAKRASFNISAVVHLIARSALGPITEEMRMAMGAFALPDWYAMGCLRRGISLLSYLIVVWKDSNRPPWVLRHDETIEGRPAADVLETNAPYQEAILRIVDTANLQNRLYEAARSERKKPRNPARSPWTPRHAA